MSIATPNTADSYFSVSFEHVLIGQPMPYELYINLAQTGGAERFLRIFPKDEVLTTEDLGAFKKKYRQLYVPETNRQDYLNSLCKSSARSDEEKTTVLKDSAIHYLDNLFDSKKEFTTEVLTQTISNCRDVVENMVDVIHSYKIDQLQSLIGKLSFHDFYTYDHSINVSMYCILLYQYARPQADRHEIVTAGLGGLLHDLGKIKIPTNIINKPGKLTDEEFKEIKAHPGYGNALMQDKNIQMPEKIDPSVIARIVFEHHENFDGTGYPNKIAGEKIHVLARVCSIADFFDAITTKRSYHSALTTNDALALMGKSRGTKLDPRLFDIFAQHTQEFVKNRPCNLELAPDFDPCQPQEKPVLTCGHAPEGHAKSDDFGKIRIVGNAGDWAGKSNIKVVDPIPSPSKKKVS